MSRTLSTMRLHLQAWPSWVGWPWAILVSSFLINLLIASRIELEPGDDHQTGGLFALLFVLVFSGVQALTQGYPFAAALGVTRRRYAAATGLFMVALALASGVVITLLAAIEDATGGWGVSLAFFGLDFLEVGNPALQVLVYAGPVLAVMALGTLCGAIHARWSPTGTFAAGLVSVLLVGVVLLVIAWTDSWQQVGDWLADTSPAVVAGAIPAALAVAMAAGTWRVLRRSTP